MFSYMEYIPHIGKNSRNLNRLKFICQETCIKKDSYILLS